MADFASFTHGVFSEVFTAKAERAWGRWSRILILVDGGIEVLPFPAPVAGQEFVPPSQVFGVSVVIATLKSFTSGLSSFTVTVATRDGDGSPIAGHDITGFRFSDATLAGFDQVWMFGYNPGNLEPDNLDPARDAIIEQGDVNIPNPNALSVAELAALARWMDNGGGVFATGDHHFLGASMCHKVPRVATMRRWTIADGVPTRQLPTRLDTNRPATSAQAAGTQVIPIGVEEDHVPQRIEWVPFENVRLSAFAFNRRPHPLLCHPTLGPIDILPDHPHEGLCHDFEAAYWQSTKRDLGFDFAGYANDHYPTVNGKRPLPQVIAWGTTLADPPLNHAKGDQPLRRFPQIAAYDGQEIGVGRVVVDATWHHWFDMNLQGIEAHARATGDRTDIDRILRYYINVGIYLASPEWRAGQFYGWLKAAQFGYFGREEADLSAPAVELGRAALTHLVPVIGRCWVVDLVLDHLRFVDADIRAWLKEKIGRPEPCLSCPPFELFEAAILGELVRAAYSDMGELRRQIAEKGQITSSPLFDGLDKIGVEAARRGLDAALEVYARDLERGRAEAAGPDRGAA